MPPDPNTSLTPFGLALTIAAGLLLLVLPRRYAIAPILMMCCYMTMGQSVVVVGCHFTMIRVMMLFGWTRVILHGEIRRIGLNQLDTFILWWTAVSFVAYVALWRSGDAVIYKLGEAYNVIGFYFLFRMLLRSLDDVVDVFRMLAVLIVPLAGFMLLEKSTGRNLFAVFGGVSEVTAVRDGVLRCTGPFAHPILAGTFGATVFPFFVCLWATGRTGKLIATGGAVSSSIIAITSGSSGPVLALMAGVLALLLWRMRANMRQLRIGLSLGVVCMHFLMKAPVWFLLARVDVFSGSTGYHRAILIDSAIRSLDDWWLAGTKSTASWADEEMGLFDVTNQYLHEGSEGGLFSMLLFIWVIVCGFRLVGLTWRAMAEAGEPERSQFFVWGLGAALFAHVVSYISVSYFDQNFVNWYLLLAMIATVGDQFLLVAGTERLSVSNEVEAEHEVMVPRGLSARSLAPLSLHLNYGLS